MNPTTLVLFRDLKRQFTIDLPITLAPQLCVISNGTRLDVDVHKPNNSLFHPSISTVTPAKGAVCKSLLKTGSDFRYEFYADIFQIDGVEWNSAAGTCYYSGRFIPMISVPRIIDIRAALNTQISSFSSCQGCSLCLLYTSPSPRDS